MVEKKDWASRLSVQEKKAMIEPNHSTISISRQCKLLGLPRSSFYRELKLAQETEQNLYLMRLIDEEYTRHPFMGSRKLTVYLRRQGHRVNRKRVQRLMRKMGIQSVAPKPYTSLKNKEHKVYPYLLGKLAINKVNQVWCTDITHSVWVYMNQCCVAVGSYCVMRVCLVD